MKRLIIAISLLLIPSQAWAVISAAAIWRVRPSGTATGGGFYVSGGTDYSQQDAPQYALTGVTTAGADAILLSASAAADMVGNGVYIASGTNFTVGWYEVASVSVGVSITLDRTCTTGAGAAGVVNIGGALNTVQLALTNMVADNDIGIYSGTYSVAATNNATIQGTGAGGGTLIFGHGPTASIITSASSGVHLITLNNADYYRFDNLEFTHTFGTPASRGYAIASTASFATPVSIVNCTFDGVLASVNTSFISELYMQNNVIRNTHSTSGALCLFSSGAVDVYDNSFHDCAGAAIFGDAAFTLRASRNIIDGCGYGIQSTVTNAAVSLRASKNSFWNITNDGIEIAGTSSTCFVAIDDNIFWNCDGIGVDFNETGSYHVYSFANNAWGANGTNYTDIVSTTTDADIDLTTDPYVAPASEDFELNGTADAGLACMDVGFGGFDLGALQADEDYPAEADVESGVDYYFGLLTGSLSITSAPYRSVERGGNVVEDAARNIAIRMLDSTDHVTGKTGLTLTMTASKNGAAFASITPTVTERTSGWYQIALTSSETNTAGDLALQITSAGADPLEIVYEVEPGVTVTGGLVSADVAELVPFRGTVAVVDSTTMYTFAYIQSSGDYNSYEGSDIIFYDDSNSDRPSRRRITNTEILSGVSMRVTVDSAPDFTVTTSDTAAIVYSNNSDIATRTLTNTALPNAAAGASNGLLISGTNSGTTTLGALSVTGGAALSNATGSALTISTVSEDAALLIDASAIGIEFANATTSISLSGGPMVGNITGNITGTLSTVTTLTNLPAITANWLTAAGTAADFSTEVVTAIEASAADFETEMANLGYTPTVAGRIDAAITTRLAPTVSGRTLDVTSTGAGGIDFANVENPTTTVGLSGTTIAGSTTIGTAGVGAFWNALIDDYDNVTASFGKRLGDNIDAPISEAGGNSSVLLSTTAASGSGTSYVLAAGSDVNDTYNEQTIVFYDASNSDFPSVGVVTDYVGSTKTVTIETSPVFTVAASDPVKVFVGSSFGGEGLTAQETRDALKLAPTAGAGAAGSIDARLPDTLDTGLMRSNAALSAGQIQDIADDLVAAGVGVNITPVNQEPIPPSRIWRVKATNAGLRYENTLSVQDGGVAKLFAVDFSQDLPNNGRVTDINSVAIQSGTAGGVTFGADLADVDDYGVDRSLAKFNITPVTAGTYIIRVSVDYDDGSVSVADVKLVVVD